MQIDKYFKKAIEAKASDIHLIAEQPPIVRLAGELKEAETAVLPVKVLEAMIAEILTPVQQKKFKEERELDLARAFDGWRFRINLHFQRGLPALAARLISSTIPTPEQLGLSETLYNLTHLQQGLVLVTGPTGAGKSTTLACMIDIINQERRAHVITIEDPIEYVYQPKQSVIEQREVGDDTLSFGRALKYVLRQDPNVLLVGEMRDLETVQAVLTAAETGHLVFSTLHTPSAAETIERIIDMFEGAKQRQVLVQLASVLKAVVAQHLLPDLHGGRTAAREIMITNSAIANLIRENKVAQIYSVIQTGAREGMISREGAVRQLYEQGVIDEATARMYTTNRV